MISSSISLLFAAALQSVFVTAAWTGDAWKGAPRQLLQASSKLSHLQSRDTGFTLTRNATLHFAADPENVPDDWFTVMNVHIRSETPFLMIEDNEEILQKVTCGNSTIRLEFASEESLEDSREALSSLEGSYVVTSHAGCNEDGARAVYAVEGVWSIEAATAIVLQTQFVSWNEAFPNFCMSLDSQQQAIEYASRAAILRKRHVPANLSDIPTPVPPRHNTTTNRTSTADLAHSLIDHQFSSFGLVGGKLPLTLSCKNCSTTGSMSLRRGDFAFANSSRILDEMTDDVDDNLQILETGLLEMEINNFSAHIELESELARSFGRGFDLFEVPIVGYEIPHFGILGVFLNMTLVTSFETKGGLSFGYGFDVALPSGSNITVDFANVNKSSSYGFSNATLTPLPVKSNLTALDLTVSAALHPQILIGFALNEKALGQSLSASMEAGVFMDLPQLTSTISIAPENVDETCSPDLGLSIQHKDFLRELGNLTHITPTLGVDLGVQANVGVKANKRSKGVAYPTVLLSTAMALPTACLAYDSAAKTFGDAQEMFASLTSAAAASSSSASMSASRASASRASASAAQASHSGAAGMLRPPLTDLFTMRDGIMLMGSTVALMIAAGVFAVL